MGIKLDIIENMRFLIFFRKKRKNFGFLMYNKNVKKFS